MKPIDWSKPVVTRNGIKVRVICTDGPNPHEPVVGCLNGHCDLHTWAADGRYLDPQRTNSLSVVNAPERVERWANLYGDQVGVINKSREDADAQAGSCRRTGVIRITYEDGKPVAVALEDAQ